MSFNYSRSFLMNRIILTGECASSPRITFSQPRSQCPSRGMSFLIKDCSPSEGLQYFTVMSPGHVTKLLLTCSWQQTVIMNSQSFLLGLANFNACRLQLIVWIQNVIRFGGSGTESVLKCCFFQHMAGSSCKEMNISLIPYMFGFSLTDYSILY